MTPLVLPETIDASITTLLTKKNGCVATYRNGSTYYPSFTIQDIVTDLVRNDPSLSAQIKPLSNSVRKYITDLALKKILLPAGRDRNSGKIYISGASITK